MNTKKSLLLATITLMLTAFSWSAERPNIVFILTDDQGVNDIGCYGSEILTPHIDSLAHEAPSLIIFMSLLRYARHRASLF